MEEVLPSGWMWQLEAGHQGPWNGGKDGCSLPGMEKQQEETEKCWSSGSTGSLRAATPLPQDLKPSVDLSIPFRKDGQDGCNGISDYYLYCHVMV